MNGIYPDYVGPDTNYRRVSLFPDWIGVLGGGLIPTPWYGGAEVLSLSPGIAMVVNKLGSIQHRVYSGVTAENDDYGVTTRGVPGVEVDDEEPGT